MRSLDFLVVVLYVLFILFNIYRIFGSVFFIGNVIQNGDLLFNLKFFSVKYFQVKVESIIVVKLGNEVGEVIELDILGSVKVDFYCLLVFELYFYFVNN